MVVTTRTKRPWHRRPLLWIITSVGLMVLVVLFLLFRPDKLWVDDTVDESLADAFSDMPIAAEETLPPTTTPTTLPPETTTTVVNHTDDSNPVDQDIASTTTTSSTTSSTTTTTTTVPAGPVAIGSGPFSGINHRAEGTATLYQQAERNVLRFEDDTDIQNGPDLYVWLVADTEYMESDGTPEDYINLGKIKGNVGGQNYILPAEFDPGRHRAVLIWCHRFSVPFATAPLAREIP